MELSGDFYSVRVSDTVDQALARIRESPKTAEIFYCYTVDGQNRLQGVVPIRKLITSFPTARIADIQFGRIVKLPRDAPDSLVEDFFVTYRFLAFPVVDGENHLLGVTKLQSFVERYTDSLFDEVEGRVRGDVFRFLGLPEEELTEPSSLRLALKRLPWLLLNVAGGLAAAGITLAFQHTLDRVVAIAFFIPVVLVLSESIGVQATAVAGAWPRNKDLRQLLRREVEAAALAGLCCGGVVALASLLWRSALGLSAALALAIPLAASTVATLASLLPALFRRLRVNPAYASSPLVLAVSDNVTLLTYLALAWWLAVPAAH